MGFAVSCKAVAAALLAASSLGLRWTQGWAATGWAAQLSAVDLSFQPHIDAPATQDETGWLMQPHTPLPWREPNLKPLRGADLSGATAKLPALWALSAATSIGHTQQTFDMGVKGPNSTSANDLTTLAEAITVYGKFSLAHPLPHYPSIKLGESIHLSKTGMKWTGGLGLSINWDNRLTLYGDASVQGSLLDIDIKDLSANIGVRYVFL